MLRARRTSPLLFLFFGAAIVLIVAIGLVSIQIVRSYARTTERILQVEDIRTAMTRLAARSRTAAQRLTGLIAGGVAVTVALLAIVYVQFR